MKKDVNSVDVLLVVSLLAAMIFHVSAIASMVLRSTEMDVMFANAEKHQLCAMRSCAICTVSTVLNVMRTVVRFASATSAVLSDV